MRDLPPDYRVVWLMRDVEGLTPKNRGGPGNQHPQRQDASAPGETGPSQAVGRLSSRWELLYEQRARAPSQSRLRGLAERVSEYLDGELPLELKSRWRSMSEPAPTAEIVDLLRRIRDLAHLLPVVVASGAPQGPVRVVKGAWAPDYFRAGGRDVPGVPASLPAGGGSRHRPSLALLFNRWRFAHECRTRVCLMAGTLVIRARTRLTATPGSSSGRLCGRQPVPVIVHRVLPGGDHPR